MDKIDDNDFKNSVYNVSDIIPEYKVLKSDYSPQERILLGELRENLVNQAISSNNNIKTNEFELLNDIKDFLLFKLAENDLNMNFDKKYLNNLSKKFFQDIMGYGEIDPLIKDDNLEEIMVIGVNKPVFVYHRKLGMIKSNLIFKNELEIVDLIDSIARQINRRIDQESPILDGRLIDGSRVNATISPISADGPSLTIRKFKKDPLTIVDLINLGTISSELAAFLWLCIDGIGVKSANAIISGGTSSGKTTMLNALSSFINPKERIISIEDTLELQIPHDHIIRMETRPPNVENKGELTMDDLVKNSLRQRPDRIIVGEVRSREAITLFTALNTGHSVFGTLHSNNARETITRLTNAPMSVPKIMISALDFIIMQNRIYKSKGESVRRINEVAEVVGMEEGIVQLNNIFKWNPETNRIENVSIASKTLDELSSRSGLSIDMLYNEIDNRQIFLDYLVKNKLRSILEVKEYIEKYYLDADSILNKILLQD
jgi:flagellar protein FlaI